MARPVLAQAAAGSGPATGSAVLTEAQYEWAERAAILEFEAGHSRADAERIAREQIEDSRRRAALKWRQDTLWEQRTNDRR